MKMVTLNNGVEMPQLGFGVWKVKDEEAQPAVSKALETGYTSIDTAMIYQNETGVGKALQSRLLTEKNSLSQQKFGIPIKGMTKPSLHLKRA